MPADEETPRRAFVDYHRRGACTQLINSLVLVPITQFGRARRAHAAGDGWGYAAVALRPLSIVLNFVSQYRRAEQRADQDLARAAMVRANRERLARGEAISLTDIPGEATLPGWLAMVGLLIAGGVRGGWDYAHRPGRRRDPVRPRWRLRPGPAWWTAWSFQHLPVNATSTAPRAQQIDYERRRVITVAAMGSAAGSVTVWERTLRPALGERDLLHVAAGMVAVASSVVGAVADYRLMPLKIDTQRARRRRHDAAVAALTAAHQVGAPGPGNPWRLEMLLAAGAAAALLPVAVLQVRLVRARPSRTTRSP